MVVIATRYWFDGPGIESRGGQDFLHPSRPILGLTHPPILCYTLGTRLFPGVMRMGRVVDRTPPSSAKVKEKVHV